MSDPLQWPVASATPFRTSTDSSFKGVKFTSWIHSRRWNWITAHTKLIQRTIAGGTQQISHLWLMTHDRLEGQYLFTCSATNRCQEIVFCPFWKGEKKTGQNSHLAYGISKSRQRELARLLRQNHGVTYFTSSQKAPRNWWNHAPLTTPPFKFCCPSDNTRHFQCGFTWHLQYFKPLLGWLKRRTRTQFDVHVKRKSRKVTCLLASRRFGELN